MEKGFTPLFDRLSTVKGNSGGVQVRLRVQYKLQRRREPGREVSVRGRGQIQTLLRALLASPPVHALPANPGLLQRRPVVSYSRRRAVQGREKTRRASPLLVSPGFPRLQHLLPKKQRSGPCLCERWTDSRVQSRPRSLSSKAIRARQTRP